jgi:hypothetical protein
VIGKETMKQYFHTLVCPSSIKEIAYENIKRQIILGNIKPGRWLREQELNVLQVHDIVDNVSLEAEHIANGVERHISSLLIPENDIRIELGEGLRYILPQHLNYLDDTVFSFRVKTPGNKKQIVFSNDKRIIKKKIFIRVNPAEMIRIKLTSSELSDIKHLKVELN